MKIVLVSGKAGSGKDTFGSALKEALEKNGKRVLIAHYGDLVKYVCKTFFDWNEIKDERGRSLLQEVGTDVIREQNPDFWVDFLLFVLKCFPSKWDYVLIPDCRFKNEVDKVKEIGFDAKLVRIIRNNFQSGLSDKQKSHISETALDDVNPDFLVDNNGSLEELGSQINKFIKECLHE